jgi:hypothetical protein
MNYPNMSYCMCGNTLAALEQIMDAMDEQGAVEFVKDLNMDELRAFNELMHVANLFSRRAVRAVDQVIDDRVDSVLGVDKE